jgi:hypothetical protein
MAEARTDDSGPATVGPESSDPAEDGYEPPTFRLPRDWRASLCSIPLTGAIPASSKGARRSGSAGTLALSLALGRRLFEQ